MTLITLHMLVIRDQLKTAHFMTVVQELDCRCREHLYSNNDVQPTVLKCCQFTHLLRDTGGTCCFVEQGYHGWYSD
jgi:hypothetical protein